MANIKRVARVDDRDFPAVTRAQNRLQVLHRKLKNWRAVAEKIGVKNMAYPYALVVQGKVPSNPSIRAKLFLPRVLPSEKKVRVKKFVPVLGSPEWEAYWMKRPRVNRWQAKLCVCVHPGQLDKKRICQKCGRPFFRRRK